MSSAQAAPLSRTKALIKGPAFDYVFLIACVWFQGGGWLDAWAHRHVLELETFFTPWHAVLYSGFLVSALILIGVVILNRLRGASSWAEAIPPGYALSLYGVAGFVVGGVFDGVWHTLFGIEQSIDAQFSPSHMVLLIFGVLFLLGPFRALHLRKAQATISGKILFTLITILLFLLFNINTQTFHPLVDLWPLSSTAANIPLQTLAVVSIIIQGLILAGILLYMIRQFPDHVYPGFFALVLTLMTIPISFMGDYYATLPMALGSGLIIDGLYFLLKPSLDRVLQLRVFILLLVVVYYTAYFIMLTFMGPILWTIHLIGGSIVTTAILAYTMTYLIVPAHLSEPAQTTSE